MVKSNLENIAIRLLSENQLITERFDAIQESIDDGSVAASSDDDKQNVKKEMDALSKALKRLKESRKRLKKLKKTYFETAKG
jgi:mevalonate kinase